MAASPSITKPSLLLLCRPNPTPSNTIPLRFSCFHRSFSTAAAISVSNSPPFALPLPSKPRRTPRLLAAVAEEEETAVVTADESEANDGGEDGLPGGETRNPKPRPCELYVCNLPRSCDISQLSDLFKIYGTVLSVEVSRDAVTGISRGCGYVTMSSIPEAKAAVAALDGSDLGGREVRVKFSVDMVSGRTNTAALNSTSKKDMIYESPYKVYVGNLAWSVRPEDLRQHFSQFGTVVSVRVLYDRKGGRNRVYAFLSFSSADEVKASVETSGSMFHGRIILVREVVDKVSVTPSSI